MKNTSLSILLVCLCAVVNADIITATYDTNEQVLINVENIPVNMVEVYVPKIQVPTVDVPSNTVEVPVQEIEVPKIDVPSNENLGLFEVQDTISIPIDELNIPEVAVVDISVFKEEDINGRINELIRLLDTLKNNVHDKRNIEYDTSLSSRNEALKKWIAIYEDYKKSDKKRMTYVPIHTGMKMIAEAHVPKNEEEANHQRDNLVWYKSKGFNAVLLTVYMDESLTDLISLAHSIKSYGYDLYFAYSEIESLETSVFKDPDVIKRYISALAPMSRGMLLGWRRTSVHLFIQDSAFSNYLITCAREANPNIEILGEGYYGATADTDHSTNRLTYNMPENSSACVMIGVGYRNTNASDVVYDLFKQIPKGKQIPVILGDTAYYLNKNNNTFDQNFQIKKEIEFRFLRVGIKNTIMFHGDGKSHITDSLTSKRK